MVQVHTVYESHAWRNKVDGLQQGIAHTSRPCAVAAGRGITAGLGGSHFIHDVDGSLLDQYVYDLADDVSALGAMRYIA